MIDVAGAVPTPIRINLTGADRELVETAAAAAGVPLDDFARSALLEQARARVASMPTRKLSERDALRFVEIMEADAEPNEALRRAAARYWAEQ